jgi:hypothetical protein
VLVIASSAFFSRPAYVQYRRADRRHPGALRQV